MIARLRKLLPVLLPVSIFMGHVSVFGTWIVDDAGIVFSVARNVAQGFGLVCQAGGERVEAFSSLPWVVMMASTFALGIFHLVWVPKVVSIALIAAAFSLVYLTLAEAAQSGKWVALAGLCWTSSQTGFVVWSTSGLENPLYVFVLSVLLAYVLRDVRRDHDGGCPGRVGIAATIVSITRPEGILYMFAYPMWRVLLAMFGWRRMPQLRGPVRYTVGVGSVFLAFIWFRWRYFGELLPNTYYAKGGPTWQTVGDLVSLREPIVAKLLGLMEAIGGRWAGGWILVLVCGGTIWLWSRCLSHPIHGVLSILAVCSGMGYVLLPTDWMGEYRYATPFFLFFYLYAAALLWTVVDHVAARQKTRVVSFAVVSAAVLVGTLLLASQRSAAFARHPTLPIQEVIDTGRHFERLAVILGVGSPSVLTPSVGGALLQVRVRIYDLGMLCDRVMAQSLGEGAVRLDRQRFYDYVFEELRPTLISTSAFHTWLARLDEDPRFRRDYAPIKEYVDQWVRQRYAVTLYSGEFVRREVLSGKTEVLSRVQEEVGRTRYFGCAECE